MQSNNMQWNNCYGTYLLFWNLEKNHPVYSQLDLDLPVAVQTTTKHVCFRVPYASATSTFWIVVAFFSGIGNENVTTNGVVTLLSHFATLFATKMRQQSHNFHQSKRNIIPCTFTWCTTGEIIKNIWHASYFALICCDIL